MIGQVVRECPMYEKTESSPLSTDRERYMIPGTSFFAARKNTTYKTGCHAGGIIREMRALSLFTVGPDMSTTWYASGTTVKEESAV